MNEKGGQCFLLKERNKALISLWIETFVYLAKISIVEEIVSVEMKIFVDDFFD